MDGYPKFISNQPAGTDKFDGGSQKRLAKAIAEYFRTMDKCAAEAEQKIPRIIGIEGAWGAGKSNVVKLVEAELRNDKYYFFEYDAWGNQEDLQRRSFLEQFTSKLVEDDILKKNTILRLLDGSSKEVTWKKKLEYLLAKKRETNTLKFPLISYGVVAAFLLSICTTMFSALADSLNTSPILTLLIAAVPTIIFLLAWGIVYLNNHKYGLSYLLAIYQNKIEEHICYETISEDEPSVSEFKSWMKDVSDRLNKKKAERLVVVFDNMDRLTTIKLKQLWSSINTFFAGKGFDNIWVIIPFDREHLSCAFGNESGKESELTAHFINKTFPVVYRVAPPVISDYKKIFDKLFVEAFDTGCLEADIINRIYRIARPNANVREIIVFINQLVALKNTWRDEISLTSMAIFVLFKDIIEETGTDNGNASIKHLLSGDYLQEIANIGIDRRKVDEEMAALFYGVSIDCAKQIPMMRYIEKCLGGTMDFDINEYAESNPEFDTILRNVCDGLDNANLDKAIRVLDGLSKTNSVITGIWNDLAWRIIEESKEPFDEEITISEHKILLKHTSENVHSKILAESYRRISDTTEDKFSGEKYFEQIDDLSKFIQEQGIEAKLPIKELEVRPETFIEYVSAAGEKYSEYLLSADAGKLDEYLASTTLKSQHYAIVKCLVADKTYRFNKLKEKIEQVLDEGKDVTKQNWGDIINTYKLLCKKNEKLSHMLKAQQIVSLLLELRNNNLKTSEAGYFDLLAASLAISKANTVITSDEVPEVAEVMDYYEEHGTMLLSAINLRQYQGLCAVMKYAVENQLGTNADIWELLPKYDTLRSALGVSDEMLIEHLNLWEVSSKDIQYKKISEIIPNQSFYLQMVNIKNALTDRIFAKAYDELSQVPADTLYAEKSGTSYWSIYINSTIGTERMAIIPECVKAFAKKLYMDYANPSITLNEYQKKVIDNVNIADIGDVFSNIRNLYCNGQIKITAERFIRLEEGLREHGNLLDRASDVTNDILKPVISNPECRELVSQHVEKYAEIVNKATNKEEFVKLISKILEQNKDDVIADFAKAIDADKMKKD